MTSIESLNKIRAGYLAAKEQHVAKATESLHVIEALQASLQRHSKTMAEHEAQANQFNGGVAAINDLIEAAKATAKGNKQQKGK